ncbi:MAG: NTP transferase domain-containing protein [Candidatus Obscuribacterales bacterium]|nr:NTP transferase domain-containing protein [Steroidobacteraceae bacterium]
MISPPLYGLVLAGGASTRMGRDKAALAYHGQSQLHWAFDLLAQTCARAFVSIRSDQCNEPLRAGLPQIVDAQPGLGPLAGISAALASYPDVAWLILACDLPFLSSTSLEQLIAHRDPSRIATAYRSAHDGLPEPLCAIWEPAARGRVEEWLGAGKQCPRKLLINSNAALLDQLDPRGLDNINTPSEFDSARAVLS